MRSITIGVLFCMLCPLAGMTASNNTTYSFEKSFDRIDNCFQRYSDTVSSLWLTYSNRMALGRPFMVDSPFPDDNAR